MTMTVKLDAPLERSLRQRSAYLGRPASALMRDALQAYLAQTEPAQASSFALGADLFGRYSGPKTLASRRKTGLAQIWDKKRPEAVLKAAARAQPTPQPTPQPSKQPVVQSARQPVKLPIKRAARAKA